MILNLNLIRAADPQMADAMGLELNRQREHIELIASENFVSPAVLEAMGSHLTNKYAEGYPGKRYYGGCECVDIVEKLVIDRAKELFEADHANVQPHSGAQANLSVYFALLEPGDTILGMNLSHGGHLTHGSPVSISGKYFNAVPYGVAESDERIDYDELRKIARETKPKMIIAGASAYPRTIDFAAFREIADEVGAYFMVDMAHIAGLVAAGEHPSPVPYADVVTSTTHKTLRGPRGGLILCKKKFAKAVDKGIFPGTQGGPLMHIIAAKGVCFHEALQPAFAEYQRQVVANARALAEALIGHGVKLVSGGTDIHLMLLNLADTGVTGKDLENLLVRANITANKNTIPFETLSPMVTSGLRVGTPAVTTRGMKEPEMVKIAAMLADVIKNGEDALPGVQAKAVALCEAFPLYK